MDEREFEDAMERLADALFGPVWAWMAAFGAFDTPEVCGNVTRGLAGAIVGAPADPEAFG
jgi:hypothetical protein